jgi:hypothetical protein
MGNEKLNIAAWAAGFAMATIEEDDLEVVAESASRAADTQWRPGQAVMVREPQPDKADWIRAFFGLFGRRAPVSPA